jgi:long-chain acyl-CoA synthetase
VFPALRVLYRLDVEGAEHLAGTEPRVLIANHASHLDNGLILLALPLAIRRRLAIAAAADTIFKRRGQGDLAALVGNAFPIARGGGTQWSVDYCCWLLEGGWSILLFPEGKLTVGGPIQPFRRGIAVLATAAAVPIVPMRLDVCRRGIGEGRRLPLRGHIRLRVGPPRSFPLGTDAESIVATLQDAVAAL